MEKEEIIVTVGDTTTKVDTLEEAIEIWEKEINS